MVTACILTGRITDVRCGSSGLCPAGDLIVEIARDPRQIKLIWIYRREGLIDPDRKPLRWSYFISSENYRQSGCFEIDKIKGSTGKVEDWTARGCVWAGGGSGGGCGDADAGAGGAAASWARGGDVTIQTTIPPDHTFGSGLSTGKRLIGTRINTCGASR